MTRPLPFASRLADHLTRQPDPVTVRRLSLTAMALLAFTALIGLILSVALTPPHLHDRLNALASRPAPVQPVKAWTPSDMASRLAPADRSAIEAAYAALLAGDNGAQSRLIGQAARTKASAPAAGDDALSFTLRLDPVFDVRYAHRQRLVADIRETSQRVDIRLDRDTGALIDLRRQTETRGLRFVRTRAGWALKQVREEEDVQLTSLRGRLSELAPLPRLVGINYYPSSAPWGAFWTTYPTAEIERDLLRIRALGANAVRIFLDYRAFEDVASRETSLARLADFLDRAAELDIKVILTPFDMGFDPAPSGLPAAWTHLDRILERVAGHPAFVLLDLKNQPDLDDDLYGPGAIDAFLTVMATEVRAAYPGVKLTIGWSDSATALRLEPLVDAVSFHDYRRPSGLAERFGAVRSTTRKPVLVTEIGETAWTPLGLRPGQQARRLTQRLDALVRADGVFVWTLNDFPNVPSGVAGWQPWRKAQQSRYGLFDVEGEPRGAASVFNQFAILFMTPKP